MTTTQKWVIGIFVALYLVTGGISTIHSIDFFKLANPDWLAIALAAAFEIGAMACLAAIIVLDKTTRWMVWTLFALVTGIQILGNMYYSYSHLSNFSQWSELFGLIDQDQMFQKRILSIATGGILPIVALGFIKSLVDVARPKPSKETQEIEPSESISLESPVQTVEETPNRPDLEPVDLSTDLAQAPVPGPIDSPNPEPAPPRYGPM